MAQPQIPTLPPVIAKIRTTTWCTMFVVRHGTTTMNVDSRYRGRRDVPLDAQGYRDAADAATKLSRVGLTAVYCNALRRTMATAQIIADEARVPDLRILHGLINLDYGAWEGLTAAEAEARDPKAFGLYKRSPFRAVCPNGERLSDARDRILDALRLIGSRHIGETVAVVTHAVMIRLALAELTGQANEQWRRPVGLGSITTICSDGGALWCAGTPEGTDVD
jgi:broad specificity phosphatase PhoE